ncbi:MAG: hypothetical protein H6983_12570 [Ectothiorhodospiraceae bacterium]|nr:hypothetical protein [Chromatiales bacterium]MCP5154996.1 hypothetical protein [Ectothiorhodospiraceae bacterium]
MSTPPDRPEPTHRVPPGEATERDTAADPRGDAGRAPPRRTDGTTGPLDDGALDRALDDLEDILGHRDGRESDSAPHSVPLLDDVVVRGDRRGAGIDALGLSPEEARALERVAVRLASEIEVILNARIETAVTEALEDVRRQVRNHIEIILPEILDELGLLAPRDED